MFARARSCALALLVLILGGCATLQHHGRTIRSEGGIRNEGGVTIISGAALDGGGGSIIDALRWQIPGMRVHGEMEGCPQISLRSHVVFNAHVKPLVYVDGTRSVGTCLLESLRTQDVEAVEIYPMGVAKRPGYATHSSGLILVFMRSANS
jgi:hypothetical protein